MITLALYFFNLLPLSFLDGAQFFDALCDFAAALPSHSSRGSQMELDELEAGRDHAPTGGHDPNPANDMPWKGKIIRALQVVIWCLVAFCTLGAMVQQFS